MQSTESKDVRTMDFTEETVLPHLHRLTYSYSVPNFKGTMINYGDLERGCPLDNGRRYGQDTANLGAFEALPIELLQTILLDIDLQSLTCLRSVNRRTLLMIDRLWQYKEIIMYAPHSLRAALSINVGAWITCRQLHTELCSQICVACGGFGPVLYLLTCSRVCYVCLLEDQRFLPLVPSIASSTFVLSASDVANLPTASTLPGQYSLGQKVRRTRAFLVDRTAVVQAATKHYVSREQMEAHVSGVEAKRFATYTSAIRARRITGSQYPPLPAFSDIPDEKGGNPARFACAVRFPWFERSTGTIQWGLHCAGCQNKLRDQTDGKLDWRWMYTPHSYVDHVGQCSESIETLKSIV